MKIVITIVLIENGKLKMENYDYRHKGNKANHNSQLSTLNSQFDNKANHNYQLSILN